MLLVNKHFVQLRADIFIRFSFSIKFQGKASSSCITASSTSSNVKLKDITSFSFAKCHCNTLTIYCYPVSNSVNWKISISDRKKWTWQKFWKLSLWQTRICARKKKSFQNASVTHCNMPRFCNCKFSNVWRADHGRLQCMQVTSTLMLAVCNKLILLPD